MSNLCSTYRERTRISSNPGSDIKIDLEAVLDKNHELQVIEVGQHSMSDYINSFDCDIATLISRAVAGDSSVLRSDGVFDENFVAPNSVFEMQTIVNTVGAAYDEVDHSKYPNVTSFIQGLFAGDFADKPEDGGKPSIEVKPGPVIPVDPVPGGGN